jgi:long-chain acyl-CoA synthetase
LVRNGPVWRALRIALHAAVRAYLRGLHGYRARSAMPLERTRGCLVVANHASHMDVPVLFSAWPLRCVNRLRSLCAQDYFAGHPVRWLVSFLLGNAIPMDRTRFDRRAVAVARRELAAGCDLVVFPAGTRSPDGRIGQFKAGVGLLAVRDGLAVIPAYISGTHACCRKGAWWPRPGPIEVVFDRPVRYAGLADCKSNWVRVASDLRRRVVRLAAHAAEETAGHEQGADSNAAGAGPHGGAAEPRGAHRLRPRGHLRHLPRLRVSQ